LGLRRNNGFRAETVEQYVFEVFFARHELIGRHAERHERGHRAVVAARVA